MSIKTVIFDLDQTLYDFMKGHYVANRAVGDYASKHFGLSHEETDRLVMESMDRVREIVGHDNPAYHSRILRMKYLLEQLGEDALVHTLPMADVYWNSFYETIELLPEVEEVLRILKSKGLKIVICTDMQVDVQIHKIEHLGIGKYIDYLVTSEESNCEKPGDAILAMCAKKSGAKPEECLFVGDHPKKDVLGPIAYGMQGAWCKVFDIEDFMRTYHVKVSESELATIEHSFDDFGACITGDGNIDFGGIIL